MLFFRLVYDEHSHFIISFFHYNHFYSHWNSKTFLFLFHSFFNFIFCEILSSRMQISAQIRFFRWLTSNYPLIHFHIYMIEKNSRPKTFFTPSNWTFIWELRTIMNRNLAKLTLIYHFAAVAAWNNKRDERAFLSHLVGMVHARWSSASRRFTAKKSSAQCFRPMLHARFSLSREKSWERRKTSTMAKATKQQQNCYSLRNSLTTAVEKRMMRQKSIEISIASSSSPHR